MHHGVNIILNVILLLQDKQENRHQVHLLWIETREFILPGTKLKIKLQDYEDILSYLF